ncbi:MAG: hypothetical protein ACM33U_05135 [Solirubrobacterales bacterium]
MAWPADSTTSFRRHPMECFDSLREPAVRWIGGPGAGTAAV